MKQISTLVLNNTQQQLLALIYSNKNKPLNISQTVAAKPNLIGARNLLCTLNAIEYNEKNKQYHVSDIGRQVAIDNDIIDDMENLTAKGQQLLSQISPTNGNQQPQNSEFDMGMGNSDMGMGNSDMGLPPMEGFSNLFKSLLNG